MKKTKQIEVTVCDVCGMSYDPPRDIYISECVFCGADVCDKHCVTLDAAIICSSHIDPEILRKLK